MRDIEELIQNDLLFTICLWMLLIVIVCRGVWWIYSNILERKLNINKRNPADRLYAGRGVDYRAEKSGLPSGRGNRRGRTRQYVFSVQI